MTYAEFESLKDTYFSGWVQREFNANGKPAGLVLTYQCEIHIVLYNNHKRALTRKNIREHLASLLDTYGLVMTRYPLAEGEPKLMTKLGFKKSWQDNINSYWVLDSLPFDKESK